MKDAMVTKTKLRERGWTPKLIEDLLGEPDETRLNPRYRSGHLMCLWDARRVQDAEQDYVFVQAQERLAGLRTKAKARAAAARETEIAWARTTPILLQAAQGLSLKTLRKEVIAVGRVGGGLLLAHIRHRRTNYDALTSKVRACNPDAYLVICERVTDTIVSRWPDLRAAGERFMERKRADEDFRRALVVKT